MRLQISIDNMGTQIDTTDPELLARWILEIFARIPEITPATYITVQVYPSWLPNPADRFGPWVCDWVADSRIIGQQIPVRSPQELVDALQQQLRDAAALT